MNIIVSSCLLGYNCKYNGQNNYNSLLCEFLDSNNFEVVDVCPEVFGGLSIPRTPSEIKGDKVFFKTGEDVTKNFVDGGLKALKIAKDNNCKCAVLKAKSPSCGLGLIYDGTFTGTLTEGNGITCDLFLKNDIKVYTEHNFNEILKEIKRES